MHIKFSVSDGSSPAVNFWVVNETALQKFNTSQSFTYYTAPSRPSISIVDTDWTPPLNTKIYFLWDNTNGISPKTVNALLAYGDYNPVLPYRWVLTLGLGLLFFGLGTASFGYKPPASSKRTLIAGYAFAAAGGLIGIFIGLDLLRRELPNEKLHGKIIIVMGIIATLAYMSIFYLPK